MRTDRWCLLLSVCKETFFIFISSCSSFKTWASGWGYEVPSFPSSMMFPEPWRKEVWYRCSVDTSTPCSFLLCILTSCESVLISIYWKTKFLRWSLKSKLIYGYNIYKNTLLLDPFSKIIVVGSPLGSMHSFIIPDMSSILLNRFKSKQKVASSPNNIHAPIVLMDICLTGPSLL